MIINKVLLRSCVFAFTTALLWAWLPPAHAENITQPACQDLANYRDQVYGAFDISEYPAPREAIWIDLFGKQLADWSVTDLNSLRDILLQCRTTGQAFQNWVDDRFFNERLNWFINRLSEEIANETARTKREARLEFERQQTLALRQIERERNETALIEESRPATIDSQNQNEEPLNLSQNSQPHGTAEAEPPFQKDAIDTENIGLKTPQCEQLLTPEGYELPVFDLSGNFNRSEALWTELFGKTLPEWTDEDVFALASFLWECRAQGVAFQAWVNDSLFAGRLEDYRTRLSERIQYEQRIAAEELQRAEAREAQERLDAERAMVARALQVFEDRISAVRHKYETRSEQPADLSELNTIITELDRLSGDTRFRNSGRWESLLSQAIMLAEEMEQRPTYAGDFDSTFVIVYLVGEQCHEHGVAFSRDDMKRYSEALKIYVDRFNFSDQEWDRIWQTYARSVSPAALTRAACAEAHQIALAVMYELGTKEVAPAPFR